MNGERWLGSFIETINENSDQSYRQLDQPWHTLFITRSSGVIFIFCDELILSYAVTRPINSAPFVSK